MSEVTRILGAIEAGDTQAAEELLPLVYDELRRLASQRLTQEAPGHTLQPTALVHEAYLRLVRNEKGHAWDGRGHFFAAAAEAMRRILIESARRKRRAKHGGGAKRIGMPVDVAEVGDDDDVLELDSALRKFAEKYPIHARLVELRYFAGLSGEEAASILAVSPSTADRFWVFARAWLRRELQKDRP
jgi:RNA polymerase sigma factor (TIGR02999 family)